MELSLLVFGMALKFPSNIELNNQINIHSDYSYLPQNTPNINKEIAETIAQCDNNKFWHQPSNCKDCKKINITFPKIHKLLNCKSYNHQREQIIDSLLTELDFYKNKYDIDYILKDGIKYIDSIQQINELLHNLKYNKNITTNIFWIPGHTGNQWNDIADEIAKQAAKSWPKPPLRRPFEIPTGIG